MTKNFEVSDYPLMLLITHDYLLIVNYIVMLHICYNFRQFFFIINECFVTIIIGNEKLGLQV